MMKFTKMHSLGNDFIIINALQNPISITPLSICSLSDRHLGIGFDQMLVLQQRDPAAHEQTADFYCRIFNADGSEIYQCGNGLRCLAKFIFASKLTTQRSFAIATPKRIVKVHLEDGEQRVTIDMGQPIWQPSLIPLDVKEQAKRYKIATNKGEFAIGAVSLGNQHAVMQVQDVATVDVEGIGSAIASSSFFPQGANVNFMQVISPGRIKLRTYERGSGETLACGSGSCATVAVGRLWELLDDAITVCLQKGELMVKWQNLNAPLFLCGEVVTVFDGILL